MAYAFQYANHQRAKPHQQRGRDQSRIAPERAINERNSTCGDGDVLRQSMVQQVQQVVLLQWKTVCSRVIP